MPLVLVVGPSGAGKDTLIRLARAELADDPRYAFPRRLVTRPPSVDEDNEPVDAADFSRGEAEGRFCLSWRAHGLGYALPMEAGRLAAGGRVVVCNASRGVIDTARARFAQIRVVAVTAPPEELARRLEARGRPGDGDLALRLARASAVTDPIAPDLTIENAGSPDAAAGRLVGYLRGLSRRAADHRGMNAQ